MDENELVQVEVVEVTDEEFAEAEKIVTVNPDDGIGEAQEGQEQYEGEGE